MSPTESWPLGGDVDLDHFQHAAGRFIAALHVFHAAVFFLQDCLNAGPEAAVGIETLFLGFLVALDPFGAESFDLLEDDIRVFG